MIVWTEPILSSYSVKPSFAPSMVNADTIFFPASTALFVIFANAVIAATCKAENFADTTSQASLTPSILMLPAALLTFSKPSDALSNFKASFNLSKVDIDC